MGLKLATRTKQALGTCPALTARRRKSFWHHRAHQRRHSPIRASWSRPNPAASQSTFSERGIWQVKTPGNGSFLYHAAGHLSQGTKALTDLQCGSAIIAMVLRKHVATRIDQSASACSFVQQALEWRLHDAAQQGAMGTYNREDVRDTWMDDTGVREV